MAVVEVRQAATGELLTTVLLESSGSKSFDDHAIASAPKAIAQLPSPKPGGAGIHPDGIRSHWLFEVRVVYKKKLRDIRAQDDWLAFAASTPLALLGSNFDETTGDVYMLDLANPKYTCAVRLLRVY